MDGKVIRMADDSVNMSDEFLDASLPGTLPSLAVLRNKIHDLNLWHRQATGHIRCVLITGETGTGKYELAKTIVQHDQWNRAGGDAPPVAAAVRATAPLTRVLLTALP